MPNACVNACVKNPRERKNLKFFTTKGGQTLSAAHTSCRNRKKPRSLFMASWFQTPRGGNRQGNSSSRRSGRYPRFIRRKHLGSGELIRGILDALVVIHETEIGGARRSWVIVHWRCRSSVIPMLFLGANNLLRVKMFSCFEGKPSPS